VRFDSADWGAHRRRAAAVAGAVILAFMIPVSLAPAASRPDRDDQAPPHHQATRHHKADRHHKVRRHHKARHRRKPARHKKSTAPLVKTAYGVLRGIDVGAAQEFLGVPFAEPPVGDLRFRPTLPPAPWSGVKDATRQAPACLQFAQGTLKPSVSTSENCLYLNIYRPHTATRSRKLPVMVWIHGGGDVFGSSAEYDAENFAQRTHTIVVVISYRLGALGYMSLPGLDAETPQLGSGNYATLDQIQALAWVKRDIGAFGGDSQNVTIFGQSSGANSVCVLLASPMAAGMFQKAIIQSQGCDTIGNPQSSAQQQDEAFAKAEGCSGSDAAAVACLRSASTSSLVATAQEYPVSIPVSGTPIEPQPSGTAIGDGHWNKVPVMVGDVRSEGKFFVVSQAGITAQAYQGFLIKTYGPVSALAIMARYPASAYPKPFYALAAVATDSQIPTPLTPLGIACLVNSTANLFSGQTPVYRYEFNDPTSATVGGAQYNPPGIDMSNAHLAELNYLFDFTSVSRPLTQQEIPLSHQMQNYWGAFAYAGNPNVAGQPAWPRYDTATNTTLVLSPYGNHVSTTVAQEHNCAFWAQTPMINPPTGPPGEAKQGTQFDLPGGLGFYVPPNPASPVINNPSGVLPPPPSGSSNP
jgi:para-nitrobenzyl esterase